MHIGCTDALYICFMKEKIEQIREKKERLLELLELYNKVVDNTGRLYHIFEDSEVNQSEFIFKNEYQYYLVNRETNQVLCYGVKSRIISYMRLRNISFLEVMNDANDFGVF